MWLPSAGVVALAGGANGSDVATDAQIATSMSRPMRILTPQCSDAWAPQAFTCSWQIVNQSMTIEGTDGTGQELRDCQVRAAHEPGSGASSGPTSLNRNSASSPARPGADIDPVPTRARD
jgi:hypothetical protein